MSETGTVRRIARFGIFEVDLEQRELRKDGFKVKLREQSFLLLEALLERQGELVTRDELRRRLWPADTFVDFDHSLNAAMKRLRDAIEDAPDNPRFIETVPKRGYRFLAPVIFPGLAAAQSFNPHPKVDAETGRFRIPILLPVLLATVAVGWGVAHYGLRFREPSANATARILPLTTYPGAEFGSAFSSNGDRVAFVWDRNKANSTDIYVKYVGSDPPLQLTHSNGMVCCASWGPEDRDIAYEKCSGDNQGIYVVPSLGGPERKLISSACNGISWSPIGHLLAFSDRKLADKPWALFLMSVDERQSYPLTTPPPDVIGDFFPAFSPDGKSVAFFRVVSEGTTDIFVVPISGGSVRQLTFDKTFVFGVAWTPDGKNLVFSSHRGGQSSLWVVPAAGGNPRRLTIGGSSATEPAVSRQGNRLSFTQGDIHPNLWELDISKPADAHRRQATQIMQSAAYNNTAQFSPDGRKLVFASLRSGDMEVWTCEITDCSSPLQLTFLKSLTGIPRWSPEGGRISFESRPSAHSQIFVINAEGGKPVRVSDGTAEDKVSSWSADGRFIYFASNRSGTSEIWKTPADGGQATQVTHHGGHASFASADGQYLYYVKTEEPGIWRMAVGGGEEIKLVPDFPAERWGDWALQDDGIYYVDELAAHPSIKFLEFRTHKVSLVAEVDSLPPSGDPGFTVSPDKKRIVFSQVDRNAVDLMLVENFLVEP